MKGTILYGPREIRFEDRETPRLRANSGSLGSVLEHSRAR